MLSSSRVIVVKTNILLAGFYAALTAVGVYGISAPERQAAQQAVAEEQQIFNADDAQWFGDEPVVRQPLELLAIVPGKTLPGRKSRSMDWKESCRRARSCYLRACGWRK